MARYYRQPLQPERHLHILRTHTRGIFTRKMEGYPMTQTTTARTASSAAKRRRAGKYAHTLNVWPVRTRKDYDRAVAVVRELAAFAEGTLSPPDQARLDVFTDLVEAYEKKHIRTFFKNQSPLEFLKELLKDRDMNASDLGRLLDNRQLGPAILRGERQLSKAHIRTLSRYFGLPADVFLSSPD